MPAPDRKVEKLERELEYLADDMKNDIEFEVGSVARQHDSSALQVSLVDGSKYSVADVTLSENYDLAQSRPACL